MYAFFTFYLAQVGHGDAGKGATGKFMTGTKFFDWHELDRQRMKIHEFRKRRES